MLIGALLRRQLRPRLVDALAIDAVVDPGEHLPALHVLKIANQHLRHIAVDLRRDDRRTGKGRCSELGGEAAGVIAVEMAWVLQRGFAVAAPKAAIPGVKELGNSKALGIDLYTHYLYPVELAAVSVAGARVERVQALVVEEGLAYSLLGMSYLGRLSAFEATPAGLTLRP